MAKNHLPTCDHCGATFNAGAPIIDVNDDMAVVTPSERRKLIAKIEGSARYFYTDGPVGPLQTARQIIGLDTPPEWARAIAKLKVGRAIRIDAGNGEFSLIKRVK
jgi:hypothetical protein